MTPWSFTSDGTSPIVVQLPDLLLFIDVDVVIVTVREVDDDVHCLRVI